MNITNQSISRKPPVATTGIIGWLRMNLFSSWINTLITFFVLYCLYQIIPWFLNWSIFEADFTRNYLGETIVDIRSVSDDVQVEYAGNIPAVSGSSNDNTSNTTGYGLFAARFLV